MTQQLTYNNVPHYTRGMFKNIVGRKRAKTKSNETQSMQKQKQNIITL